MNSSSVGSERETSTFPSGEVQILNSAFFGLGLKKSGQLKNLSSFSNFNLNPHLGKLSKKSLKSCDSVVDLGGSAERH